MKIETIAFEEITIDPTFNVRKGEMDVEDLIDSISEKGLQVPVGVHKKRGGNYSLVVGFRRMEAISRINEAAEDNGGTKITQVMATVYPSKAKKVELMLANLQENVVRRSLNPMDEARGAKALLDGGLDDEQIRKALGWSKTLFTQRLKLVDLSKPIQQGLLEDKISVPQAHLIADLPEDAHAKFVEIAHGVTTNRVDELVAAELKKRAGLGEPELPEDTEQAGDEDTEESGADDTQTQTQLVATVRARLCDLVAKVCDEDVPAHLNTVVSILWTALPADDLEALAGLLDHLAVEGEFLGASADSEEEASEGGVPF